MSELTARHHDPGVLPGVRDAVRALLVMDEGTTWQLPDGDVSEALACAAGIVPVMLGTESEPLELGRATRYFTPGQRRLLVLRDGGCTYPGCTMPAQWTDAHHLTHWSRGGHTDIANAALLCERHHTHVHVPHLTATARGVTWHV